MKYSTTDLIDELKKTQDKSSPDHSMPWPRFRMGTVVSIQTDGTCTVTVGGDSTEIDSVHILGIVSTGQPVSLVFQGGDVWAMGSFQAIAAWETFTPVLTATTTDPTLGTAGVIEGRYQRVGTTVFARYIVKFGTSGANAGSGNYRLSLPIDCDLSMTDADTSIMGVGRAIDNSASDDVLIFPEFQTASEMSLVYHVGEATTGDAVSVSGTAPWTWAASDQVFGGFVIYEAV